MDNANLDWQRQGLPSDYLEGKFIWEFDGVAYREGYLGLGLSTNSPQIMTPPRTQSLESKGRSGSHPSQYCSIFNRLYFHHFPIYKNYYY
jgi:hypothetical protein